MMKFSRGLVGFALRGLFTGVPFQSIHLSYPGQWRHSAMDGYGTLEHHPDRALYEGEISVVKAGRLNASGDSCLFHA